MALDSQPSREPDAAGCFDEDEAAAYLEGELDAGAHQRVERHAASCSRCRELLSTLARLRVAETATREQATGPNDRTELAFASAPPATEEKRLAPGTLVGRYVVTDRVAEGGMGVVYRARDTRLERTVALKFLLAEPRIAGAPGHQELRLLREAQSIAKLAHPNVVVVYDFGTFDDQVFLAMEYVPGGTLRGWVRQGGHRWQETLDLFLQAGDGLAHAHAAGLVHRDFKPDNVLLGADGRPRVTDFGLARSATAPSAESTPAEPSPTSSPLLDARLTRTGAVMGTPAYMAPEQLRGEEATSAADQFSFCVALYEALYGHRPFSREAMKGFTVPGQRVELRKPPADSAVPPGLFPVLQRGLQAAADQRYATMNELLFALRRGSETTRRRVVWAMGAGVLVALVLGVVVVLQATRAKDDPAPALAAPLAPAIETAPTTERVAEPPLAPRPATPEPEPTPRPVKKPKSNRLQRNGMIDPF